MVIINALQKPQSFLKSDQNILSDIGIYLDDLKLLKRQKRTYYKNIVQCLRKCKIMNYQQAIDNYLEVIRYLCQTKDFSPIQTILNTPMLLNQDFPEITVSFSEYLLIKGFNAKLIAVCENILDSFANEHINLLEIEFLCTNAKSGIVDRVSSYQNFQEIYAKTEPNSLLFIQSLIGVASAQLSIGNYKNSLFNFEKLLKIIDNNLITENNTVINYLKADVLEGKARLFMIDNNWKESLSLYKELENICREYNLTTKLIHCLGHEGVINRKIQNYDIALTYFQEAKEIAIKINSDRSIEWINHHTAYVLLNQGQYDLAEQLAKECLQKAKSEKRDNETGDFYEQCGLIQLAKKKTNEAIESLELSLSFRKKVGNVHGSASSYKHLALAYLINKNYIKSYLAIKECFTIFHNLKVLGLIRTYRIVYLFLEWTIGKKSWTA
jgi:tetratricopeptide (TPR) repeat protein